MTTQNKINRIIDWLEKYKEEANCHGVVLGLSGGKDSTVVAMLAKKVWGRNVFAILMPNGEQADIQDSLKIANDLQVDWRIVNIESAFNGVINALETPEGWCGFAKNTDLKITEKSKTNIAPRIRMAILYAIAQTYGYRVIGTGNASEKYLGWCTKFGDLGCDLNPIAHLTKSEVVEIGTELAKEFGLDEKFIVKAPGDGLTGKTDEDNFGFTYDELDEYINDPLFNNLSEDKIDRIEAMHKLSYHKCRMPYTIEDETF